MKYPNDEVYRDYFLIFRVCLKIEDYSIGNFPGDIPNQ
jgi:hypothetical protein